MMSTRIGWQSFIRIRVEMKPETVNDHLLFQESHLSAVKMSSLAFASPAAGPCQTLPPKVVM